MLTRKLEDPKKKTGHTYADGPPWFFKGRAFYQLHLVKADFAKRFIPSDLKIVQAFGYTLGGFFLANYDSSPAGRFDELVVIAGIVWNPPTSCAWAARVLVNSLDACVHGRKEVGLSSAYAEFLQEGDFAVESTNSELIVPNKMNGLEVHHKTKGLTNGVNGNLTAQKKAVWKILERAGMKLKPLCSITLPMQPMSRGTLQWSGPSINISLPSFSGRTKDHPNLLQYSCHLSCRISAMQPALVMPLGSLGHDDVNACPESFEDADIGREIISLLTSRPVLACTFEDMAMRVESPRVVTPRRRSSGER